jgi:hypothetical protein
MLTARQKSPNSRGKCVSNNDHIAHIENLISKANTEDKWTFIAKEITKHKFVPAKLIYDFLQKCPHRFSAENTTIDLRLKLILDLRDFILKRLTHANVFKHEARFAVLMQAGAFYAPEEYFKHKTLVFDVYKAINKEPPNCLKERMTKIENFIKRKCASGPK